MQSLVTFNIRSNNKSKTFNVLASNTEENNKMVKENNAKQN